MAILGPRMGIFFSSSSRQFSVHDFSETIGPRLTKFGMWLRYDKMHAGIFWIFEFPIFMRFLAFKKKITLFIFRYTISPNLLVLGLRNLVCSFVMTKCMPIIFGFWNFLFLCVFWHFFTKNNFVHFSVHHISGHVRTTFMKFGMQLRYDKTKCMPILFYVFEFSIFMRFLWLYFFLFLFSVHYTSRGMRPRFMEFGMHIRYANI